jgi:hypothetical protein
MGYLIQWVNPHPELAISALKFTPGALAAKPVLLGVSTREVWNGK